MADPSSKRKSRILVPSAGGAAIFIGACVENTGDGACARMSSMRKDVIYARAAADRRPPTGVSCMRGEDIYGTDVIYGC